ncbi:ribose-phosphate pyrophosphokinase [Patescibacteria group bacterium]|nr:ribose-phosphate pyrophosphokinase [Patescibacteria group bacterium]MBU4015931.1 ribose-phosphate pyrophosphokinase [Patescibacteria group bacterium]MBU4098189.1 ribose-phosphate pyrophosphokinase [Patescibacteria group bacterium]
MKIFSGSSNKPLAKKIGKAFGQKLSPLEIYIFSDGERRVRVEEHIVGAEAVIVQSTSTPVDQNYMELFFIADAVQRSGAKSTTAVVPYLGYQRQDHIFRDGEAVSLEVVVKTLEAVGINWLIAFDLHSIKIPEVFKIPVSHLSALPLFADEIERRGWHTKDTVLVSPDMGGIRRIRILSELLGGMPYASIEKQRDLSTGKVEALGIEGSVARRAIMVDDMISSGSTMVKAAEFLREKGVEELHVFATHPVFSAEAPKLLQESLIKDVYVTDTVYIPLDKYFPKLTVLSVAGTIARAIENKRPQKINFK